ncbi:MAG: type II secretion system protein [Armatimonadota bacterium]
MKKEQPVSCFRVVSITVSVVFIIGILFILWAQSMVERIPVMANYKKCLENVTEIGAALDRYQRRNGEYPKSLSELYPGFMQKNILHCPADGGEYEYTRPKVDAPPKTIIVTCRRHVILKGRAPNLVRLQKDGTLVMPDWFK